MNIPIYVYVAAGGAAGALGRYGVDRLTGMWLGHGFPYSTLIVNVLGSCVLGVVIEASALVWSPSPELRAMIVIGILGAFTTFSAFSLDTVAMFTRGEVVPAVLYVAASVLASIGALWAGMALTKAVIS